MAVFSPRAKTRMRSAFDQRDVVGVNLAAASKARRLSALLPSPSNLMAMDVCGASGSLKSYASVTATSNRPRIAPRIAAVEMLWEPLRSLLLTAPMLPQRVGSRTAVDRSLGPLEPRNDNRTAV